jgi:hypothetical protein
MKTMILASSRRRFIRPSLLAIGLCLSPPTTATLTISGSVTDESGDTWTMGEALHIGHSGNAVDRRRRRLELAAAMV